MVMERMNLISTHTVKKSNLGFHGNLFGGQCLSWLDSAAAAYAMEVCHNRRMVTICIDECIFKRPAKEGSLLKIYGKVVKVGTTSITMYLEARSYNVFREDEKLILNTSMTFVRVDNEGVPIAISQTVKEKWTNIYTRRKN